jgi:hypothetical protein
LILELRWFLEIGVVVVKFDEIGETADAGWVFKERFEPLI